MSRMAQIDPERDRQHQTGPGMSRKVQNGPDIPGKVRIGPEMPRHTQTRKNIDVYEAINGKLKDFQDDCIFYLKCIVIVNMINLSPKVNKQFPRNIR